MSSSIQHLVSGELILPKTLRLFQKKKNKCRNSSFYRTTCPRDSELVLQLSFFSLKEWMQCHCYVKQLHVFSEFTKLSYHSITVSADKSSKRLIHADLATSQQALLHYSGFLIMLAHLRSLTSTLSSNRSLSAQKEVWFSRPTWDVIWLQKRGEGVGIINK